MVLLSIYMYIWFVLFWLYFTILYIENQTVMLNRTEKTTQSDLLKLEITQDKKIRLLYQTSVFEWQSDILITTMSNWIKVYKEFGTIGVCPDEWL